ncbi:MAG: chemotaxis protein CheW [Candidatus Margulisbacteria bacterium]|nr:chemotaxis protein CheW [Candidatus Margulisiibacteriota bacterium]
MSDAKQYLIARIKDERFAFDIQNVHEILRDQKISKVPSKLVFLEGIINVRNKVIPLINLRQKLYQTANYDKDYVVIIVSDGQKDNMVGLMADEVQEVILLPDNLIDKPMLFNKGYGEELINGIGKLESGLVIILNISNIFTEEDRVILEKVKKESIKES